VILDAILDLTKNANGYSYTWMDSIMILVSVSYPFSHMLGG